MQPITIYLKPHQKKYLESICGNPTYITAKYNLAPLLISLLQHNEYVCNFQPTNVYISDNLIKKLGEQKYISKTGCKMFGDYIDDLLDYDFWKFMKPYHKNDNLDIKDGINLFIEKNNLPNETSSMYEMLKKRDYRLRNKIYTKNPADFFNELAPG